MNQGSSGMLCYDFGVTIEFEYEGERRPQYAYCAYVGPEGTFSARTRIRGCLGSDSIRFAYLWESAAQATKMVLKKIAGAALMKPTASGAV